MSFELALENLQTSRPGWADDESTIYSVGVSGGKDSDSVLLWMVYESGIPLDRIDVTFCDTGNEHDWTYAHIELLRQRVCPITTLRPERDYYELATFKRRFPSTMARFCTQELKIWPTQDHIQFLKKSGKDVISVSGVRAEESDDRKDKREWDFSGTLLCYQWRPILQWKFADVLAIHKRYNIPLNPLYSVGAQRVGCFPCFMSRKSEIRTIAIKFPDRIEKIRNAEQEFERNYGRYSSFFARDKVPERFRSKAFQCEDGEWVNVATIDDVVAWAKTGKNAKGEFIDLPVKEKLNCNSGFCE